MKWILTENGIGFFKFLVLVLNEVLFILQTNCDENATREEKKYKIWSTKALAILKNITIQLELVMLYYF